MQKEMTVRDVTLEVADYLNYLDSIKKPHTRRLLKDYLDQKGIVVASCWAIINSYVEGILRKLNSTGILETINLISVSEVFDFIKWAQDRRRTYTIRAYDGGWVVSHIIMCTGDRPIVRSDPTFYYRPIENKVTY